MQKILVSLIVFLSLFAAACLPAVEINENATTEITDSVDIVEETQDESTEQEETAEEAGEEADEEEADEEEADEEEAEEEEAEFADENSGLPKKVVVEGDLVSFPNLKATDPDGDPISYAFTEPLDEDGKWQTKVGDAGSYKVTITASDGKNQVSQDLVIIVEPKNKPPVITLASNEIKVNEGHRVDLNVKASDPDGDKVTLTFDGWMTSATKETTFTDAGFHEVKIIASDGIATTEEVVKITVQDVNRAPKLDLISDVVITEGDKITVNPVARDPDNDKLTYSFSSPIGENGEWQTDRGDVGKYRVNVTASDGKLSDTTHFFVVVESLNQPPVIEIPELITVEEGETITLEPEITDPEEDELTITYMGWMDSPEYETTFEDAGTHITTIRVSDGINTAKKDVTIVVNDKNRAPVFEPGAFS